MRHDHIVIQSLHIVIVSVRIDAGVQVEFLESGLASFSLDFPLEGLQHQVYLIFDRQRIERLLEVVAGLDVGSAVLAGVVIVVLS